MVRRRSKFEEGKTPKTDASIGEQRNPSSNSLDWPGVQNFLSLCHYALTACSRRCYYLKIPSYLSFVLSVSLFISFRHLSSTATHHRVYPAPRLVTPYLISLVSRLCQFYCISLALDRPDMGSMAACDVTHTDHVIPKLEPMEDTLTPDSESLSPEPESAIGANEGASTSQDPAPVPKRKGGRKPVRPL